MASLLITQFAYRELAGLVASAISGAFPRSAAGAVAAVAGAAVAGAAPPPKW